MCSEMMWEGNVHLLLKHHLEPASPLWVDDTGASCSQVARVTALIALPLDCLGRTKAESEL